MHMQSYKLFKFLLLCKCTTLEYDLSYFAVSMYFCILAAEYSTFSMSIAIGRKRETEELERLRDSDK